MGNAESMPAVTMLHGYIDRNGGCDMMMDVTEAECAWAHRWYTNWFVPRQRRPAQLLTCKQECRRPGVRPANDHPVLRGHRRLHRGERRPPSPTDPVRHASAPFNPRCSLSTFQSVGSILLANLPAYKFFASLARGFGGRQARVGGLRLLPSGTSLLVAGLAIFSAGTY